MNAADTFRSRFNRSPAGVWSAPGRVNLIGEHTDYNGGYVLPFAIDLRTQAAVARRDDGRVSVLSVQRGGDPVEFAVEDLKPHANTGWAGYAVGVVWALRDKGFDVNGLDIVLDGRVPTGAGLSSSAAIECAVGLAALELSGIDLALEDMARIAQYAENEYVGVPCGLMDQMAVSVCRADHALFFDVRDDVREHEPFAPHDDGLAVLVINTRAQHAHAGGAYAERRKSCEAAAKQLGVAYLRDIARSELDAALRTLDDDVLRRRARHIITENDRVLTTVDLLRNGRLSEIGPLLTASHESLRDDFEVSAPELDTAVDAALASGALGARMTGGGFGGSAIALVNAGDVEQVKRAVAAAFEREGFVAPQFLSPKASAGVVRES
ncbi:MAG: galactokinase [Actinomycetota bacterium]|nr:galactokinase [Actinomycetota bacterium]